MDRRPQLGHRGEKCAEKFLRRRKYRIVTRNYRCPLGEIDLIALDDSTVVFVEVKTRADRYHGDPQDAVTPEKQRRLTRAAEAFLKHTSSQDRACRFDVITVTFDHDDNPEIEHFLDAFVPRR